MIYTNLTVPVDRFLRELEREVELRVSVHYPLNIEMIIKNLSKVRDSEKVLAVRVVMLTESAARVSYYQKLLDAGWNPTFTENQWGLNEKTSGLDKGMSDCTNRILLFGPDGHRYPCVKHLLGREHKGPFFWETDWGNKDIERVQTRCAKFGRCMACDGIIDSVVTLRE